MTNMIPTALEGNPQVYLHDRAPETILKTCRICKVELIMAVPLLINGLSSALQQKGIQAVRAQAPRLPRAAEYLHRHPDRMARGRHVDCQACAVQIR